HATSAIYALSLHDALPILHHQLPYDWYLNVVRIIHRAHPRLHLKGYTAVEWDWFARLTGRPTRDLLAEFKEAGLGSLPGGGAERSEEHTSELQSRGHLVCR